MKAFTGDEIIKKMSKRMIISAGVVPVKQTEDGWLFLMLRRDHYWEFPKGKQEQGEETLETAIRETCEETTLVPEDLHFKWGNISKQTDRYKKGRKYVVYYIAETEVEEIGLPINPTLGHAEHHEWKWVTYEEAKELANERISKIVDWANEVIA